MFKFINLEICFIFVTSFMLSFDASLIFLCYVYEVLCMCLLKKIYYAQCFNVIIALLFFVNCVCMEINLFIIQCKNFLNVHQNILFKDLIFPFNSY